MNLISKTSLRFYILNSQLMITRYKQQNNIIMTLKRVYFLFLFVAAMCNPSMLPGIPINNLNSLIALLANDDDDHHHHDDASGYYPRTQLLQLEIL